LYHVYKALYDQSDQIAWMIPGLTRAMTAAASVARSFAPYNCVNLSGCLSGRPVR
jgi:hypothetical protein